jgi:phospholipid/cholesterol/gamma-HCH transport system substrate-binding protein
MTFGKSTLELKVGIFVFIGMMILIAFVLLIGDLRSWHSNYFLNATFNFVNGVKIGAPVRFAGVDVGEVKEMRFISSGQGQRPKVLVAFQVRNEIKIPSDSTIWVNTLGLLGEKYIEIMPGENSNSFLRPEDTVVGNEPIAMHEVTELARNLAYDVKGLVSNVDENMVRIKNKEGTLGRLLYDDTLYKAIETIVKGLEDLTLDLKSHPWKLFFKPKEKNK